MASHQITHIHLSDESATSTEKITHIKLSNGEVETVAQAVRNLDEGHTYFYVHKDGHRPEVEAVHPRDRQPYIRTKADSSTKDNLLSLPRF